MTVLLASLDALLITNPTNVRYLTGFVGAAPEEREGYVLLTKSQVYLFTNALYRNERTEILKRSHLALPQGETLQGIEISREEPFAKKLADILKLASQGQALRSYRLGFEERDLTVAEHKKLKKELNGITLIPTQNRIEELRMIKREDEIENIRTAATITDQCFTYLAPLLKPRVTEREIAWEIESFIRSRGAELAFSPIVAFGKNTSKPHYNSNFTRPRLDGLRFQGEALKSKDIILLDFGARVNGYCSDMTRVVFVGSPKDEWRRAYETVLAAQQKALEYLTGPRPVSGTKADMIARTVIGKAGFPVYPHSLGHGVGLDIHEAPRLTINPSTRSARSGLQPGMVVTIEPAIYKEGSYGVRLEDLVVLKEDGVEVLSKSEKGMITL